MKNINGVTSTPWEREKEEKAREDTERQQVRDSTGHATYAGKLGTLPETVREEKEKGKVSYVGDVGRKDTPNSCARKPKEKAKVNHGARDTPREHMQWMSGNRGEKPNMARKRKPAWTTQNKD